MSKSMGRCFSQHRLAAAINVEEHVALVRNDPGIERREVIRALTVSQRIIRILKFEEIASTVIWIEHVKPRADLFDTAAELRVLHVSRLGERHTVRVAECP